MMSQMSRSVKTVLATLAILVLLVFFLRMGGSGHNSWLSSSRTIRSDRTGEPLGACSKVDWQERVKQVAEAQRGIKVLVTGAAGFIGSHVAEYCATALGFHVVAVDDLSGGFMENVPKQATFVKGDLKDPAFVAALFKEHGPFVYVYHLAAYAAEGLSHFIRRFNYRNNLEASVSLLNEAVKQHTKVFVFTSSIAAFGVAEELPMTESTPQHPEDPYGIAKHAMELDLKAAKHMFGIDFIIFRPHNVYGPRQNIADKFRNAIGIFMNQLLRGEPMTIFGDGLQSRAFSYIDDVAPVIAISPTVQEAYNEGFFVGSDRDYSVKELAGLVAEALGKPNNIKYLDARKEVAHAYAVHDKMRCVFNPPAPLSLREGLARTSAFVLSHGASEPVGYEDIEVNLNMPPSWVTALEEWRRSKRGKRTTVETGAGGSLAGAAAAAAAVAGTKPPVIIEETARNSPHYASVSAAVDKTGFNGWCAGSGFACAWTGHVDHAGHYVQVVLERPGTAAAAWGDGKAVPVTGFAVLSDPRKYSRRCIKSIDHAVGTLRLAVTGQHEEVMAELLGALQEAGSGAEGGSLRHVRKVVLSFHDSNIGCAGGWNRVLQAEAGAAWYLVLNNDIAFPPGVLQRIAQHMHAGVAADPVGKGFAVFGLPDLALYSAFAVSAQVLDKVGLFDENAWPLFFEDNDYTARLHCAGISAVQYADCELQHNEALGVAGEYVSGTRLLDKHGVDVEFAMAANRAFITRKWGGSVPCNVKGNCRPASCSPYGDAAAGLKDWAFKAEYRACLRRGSLNCPF